MDKREYLRSLGFTVGTRGRFTEAMLVALKDYQEPVKETTPRFPKSTARGDGVEVYTAVLVGGQILRFDTCANCKEYVKFCHCVKPTPPQWIAPEVVEYRNGE